MNIHKDYYEILEIHPKASVEVIRRAFLVLSKKYHPDLATGNKADANKKMQELNEAYGIISDSVTRKEYDFSYVKQLQEDVKYNQQSDESDIAKDRLVLHYKLVTLCNQIINECWTTVIKDITFAAMNRVYCQRAFDRFRKEVTPLVPEFIDDMNQEIFLDAMYWCALTLYVIAINFAWANDFPKAELLLVRAKNMYDPDQTCWTFRTTDKIITLIKAMLSDKRQEI